MPRDIPVGNRQLLVSFDSGYQIRDLTFPHTGQENHLGGNAVRLGVWADGRFTWVPEGWTLGLDYEEDTLVTRVDLHHPKLEILLTCRDAVDFHENVLVREIRLENLADRRRTVDLFQALDLDISGNSIGDTAAFDPASGGMVHYKGARYFLSGGMVGRTPGLAQYAAGIKHQNGREGTFRDAEDGRLSGNPIAQGSVDSVVGLRVELEPFGTATAYFWICVAKDWDEARRLDGLVKHKHPSGLIKRTADYWRLWVRKEPLPQVELPPAVLRLYRRSLLVLNTHLDDGGGIVAAVDSDVISYNRDTYAYVWPRDGALAAHALDLAGYPVPAQRFFQFAARAMSKEGCLLHKYNPDGTLASSWHPWIENGVEQLPIQEDGTALVVWALWQHFDRSRDVEFIKPLYRPLVKRAADFMVRYRDPATGLPLPSYDLWEERRGVTAFTVGAVFGGLTAASLFCAVFGEEDRAAVYRKAAAEVRDGASLHLWRRDENRFARMITFQGGRAEVDATPDSSLWGLSAFGLYDPGDERVRDTMAAVRQALGVGTGGMARYLGDGYYRGPGKGPGNPWIICSLWYADYLIRTARDGKSLEEAQAVLAWVADHALPSGVLAEQIHPDSGVPLSVSPLTWSHATFVSVTQALARRMAGDQGPGPARAQDWISRMYDEACDAIHGQCRVR